MPPLKTLLIALVLSLFAPTAVAAPAATVDVAAVYGTNQGQLNKDLVLRASQGGYLTLQNLHVLADHADELAELGLRELRIDHVFDDSFYGVVRGVDNFDFTRLDAVLRPLVEHGIRPWITISYMPSKLGPNLMGPPTDYAAWGRAVRAMVEHYATMPDPRYRGWNWEVWNEPDGAFWTGTAAQYNTLYAVSAAAVRAGDATAKVGGPGLTTQGAPMLGTWLDYLAAHRDVPADFVSWHSYGPNDFASTAQVRNEVSRRGLPTMQLYITEWNSTYQMANGPGTWPDTHQAASYALERMYRAFSEPGLSGAHFFSGLEGWNPSKDFNGDLGLLTVDGRRKAVANAFAMLNQMGDTRLQTTVSGATGTASYGLVTSDARKTSVLLWNNSLTATTFRPSVTQLPNASFTVTRYDITAANSYSDNAAGLKQLRPSPHEGLNVTSRVTLPAATSWSDTITLAPNAVTLLELAPPSDPPAPAPVTQNFARDAAVTASSSYTSPTQGWSPAALVDGRRYSYTAANQGNPTMGWTSADHPTATATESVQVDLGAARTFDTITLWPRSDQAADGAAFPVDFTISGSNDGTTWTQLVKQTGYGAVQGPQAFPAAATFRYVRVTAAKLGTPITEGAGLVYRFQLAELEVSHT